MISYLARRLLGVVPTVLGATALVFLLIHLAPGGPVLAILGPMASQEEIARTERALGLDRPLSEQYFAYLDRVAHGDLGASLRTRRPVLESFQQRLPYTAQIVILSIILSTLAAIPIGVLTGIRSRSRFDRGTMIGVLMAVSIPNFWLALMLVLIFAVRLRWVPIYGMPLITEHFTGGIVASLMPAVAIGAYHTAMLARTIRGDMIEVLAQPYMRLAKGFGLPSRQVYLKYALRNALIPVITLLGLQIRFAFGAAPVIETVFAIPGVGQYLVNGILSRDYPVVQGTLLVLVLLFIMINLVVDVGYALADPRIKW